MRIHGFLSGSALALLTMCNRARARADRSLLVPEVGFNYGEIESGRSLAMGGATRALGSGVTGIYQNPANIALTASPPSVWPRTGHARQRYVGGVLVDARHSAAERARRPAHRQTSSRFDLAVVEADLGNEKATIGAGTARDAHREQGERRAA